METKQSVFVRPPMSVWAFHFVAHIRTEALNDILVSTARVVADTKTMVDWWIQAIVEDDVPPKIGGAGFADSDITGALTRIIRALDAYCKAVS